MSEPTLLIIGGRRRCGRPRVEEPRSSVSAWIPVSEHDRLIKLADDLGMSVSGVVRFAVRQVMTRRRTQ